MTDKKRFIILANAFYNAGKGYLGGGDARCFNILNRIYKSLGPLVLVSNVDGHKIYSKNLKFSYNKVTTPHLLDFNILFSYCARSFYTFFYLLFTARKDVIYYSTSDFIPDVLPPFFLKNKKTKWVQVIHHLYPKPEKRSGGRIKNQIAYSFQKLSLFLIKIRADKIILVNGMVMEELAKQGFDRKKMFLSSNGINIEYFDGIKPGEKHYDGVFLARLHPSKGIFDLVDIWSNVCKKFPGSKLGIMGTGDEEVVKSLNRVIGEKGLGSNIELLGYLENDQVFSIIKGSKVFLFPSHEEGWGIAIAEAMACEIPVVSWDLPVFKEVFDKYTARVKEE